MKKQIFLVLFLASGFTLLNAQSGAIKVNPLGLLFGILNAGYEHVLNDKSSVEGGLSYSKIFANIGSEGVDITGFGGYLMYRQYIGKKVAPRGMYLAPNLSYNSASGTTTSGEGGSANILAVGALLGNQWVWGSDGGFLLDLSIGAAYYYPKTKGNVSGISLDGIGPQLRLAIGYAF